MSSVRALQASDRRDHGASLVEFALIAPLLFAVLLAMITGGLALSEKNSMSNAVREGTRLGATLPKGSDWSAEWAVNVRDRVLSLASNDLAADEICVQLVSKNSSGALATSGSWPAPGVPCPLDATPPPTPPSLPAGGCLVKVWAETEATLDTIFFSQDLDLVARAVGRYERTPCP